jgi:hypothetical protein
MEPKTGIEPVTYGLRNRCSTAELLRPVMMENNVSIKPTQDAKFQSVSSDKRSMRHFASNITPERNVLTGNYTVNYHVVMFLKFYILSRWKDLLFYF